MAMAWGKVKISNSKILEWVTLIFKNEKNLH